MVKKTSSGERTPLKKGAWSPEEDRKLVAYIKRYKIWNWSEMSKAAGIIFIYMWIYTSFR